MKLTDFLKDVGQPMPYYPSLARLIGVKECVLLCRLIWWHGRQADPDGWIFKTRDELSEETGLSHEEQANARKNLRAQGLLGEREERLAHKRFYRVEFTALDSLWEFQSARRPETANHGFGKPQTTVSTTPGTTVSTNTTEDTQRTPTQKPSVEGNAIPEVLQTEEFKAAWADWLAYKRARKEKLQPVSFNKQLEWLASLGERAAVATIGFTIRQNYQGLVEAKQSQNAGKPSMATRPVHDLKSRSL